MSQFSIRFNVIAFTRAGWPESCCRGTRVPEEEWPESTMGQHSRCAGICLCSFRDLRLWCSELRFDFSNPLEEATLDFRYRFALAEVSRLIKVL